MPQLQEKSNKLQEKQTNLIVSTSNKLSNNFHSLVTIFEQLNSNEINQTESQELLEEAKESYLELNSIIKTNNNSSNNNNNEKQNDIIIENKENLIEITNNKNNNNIPKNSIIQNESENENELIETKFNNLTNSIRGRIKFKDFLLLLTKLKASKESLSLTELTKLGFQVTGNSGTNMINSLRTLGYVEVNKNGLLYKHKILTTKLLKNKK